MIEIQIDKLTPCLMERANGRIFDTQINKITPAKRNYADWKFDWSIPLKNGYDIYALKIKNDKQIQGMIAIAVENNNKAVYVNLAETAPHNYGRNGKYDGVGGHLFAFACKIAYEQGYDYIYFDAKTELIEYYKDKLGAMQLGKSQRMIIEGKNFIDLLNKYFGGAEDEG